MSKRYTRRPPGLGELPEDYERSGPGLLNPGLGVATRYLNKDKTVIFQFTAGLVSVQIIPTNALRCYLLIQNKSAGNIFVNFGADATTGNALQIAPGGFYEQVGSGAFVDSGAGSFVSPDSVHILGAAANLQGVIIEAVRPAS